MKKIYTKKEYFKLLPLLHEFKCWRVDRWTLLHGLRPQRVVSHSLREMLPKHHTQKRQGRLNVEKEIQEGGADLMGGRWLVVVDSLVVHVRLRDADRRHVVAPGVDNRQAGHHRLRRHERHPRHRRRGGTHPRQVLVHAGEHHRRRRRDAAGHPHHLHQRRTDWFGQSAVASGSGVCLRFRACTLMTDLYLQLQRLEVLDGLVKHRRLVRLVTVRYELLQGSHLLVDPVSSPLHRQ
jgi:hypothetical protein